MMRVFDHSDDGDIACSSTDSGHAGDGVVGTHSSDQILELSTFRVVHDYETFIISKLTWEIAVLDCVLKTLK